MISMQESRLYKKLEDKKVQCRTCAHKCFILPESYGICGVRKNVNGKLYVLNYGTLISKSVDPIEKKPLFHFLPGTHSLSISAVGCNLRCDNCQNWQISQLVKKDKSMLEIGQRFTPKEIVEDAKANKCPSISYTYTEPTIFLEYALEVMKIAKKIKIKNIWVTNGFMSGETIDMIAPYLDAANVDIKSFEDKFYTMKCGAKIGPILENLKIMKKMGIWIEITTLIIPGFSDNKNMLKNIAKFIFEELGSNTPWHISAFSGGISWKMQNVPDTPKRKIIEIRKIGQKSGLNYVYTGNISSEEGENTYCPKCGEIAIKRIGFWIERKDSEGKCKKCDTDISLIL